MDNHSYDDIINLPHPTSKNHPCMSLHDRAAQFAPFAALTGHGAAIKETARLTDEFIPSKWFCKEEVMAIHESGVPEDLKARAPMKWVGLMNTLKA